jgi:CheY-like chemotaxis protein
MAAAAATSDGEVSRLLDEQLELARSVRRGLEQVRLVRFGVLQMRLNRAVTVTCQDEDKMAKVFLTDPDAEVDTLVIDALIEPLLHLLKNAVVHGIERPESRRLLGKPEEGCIRVGLESTSDGIRIVVEDDGRGISTSSLIDKAIAVGLIEGSARHGLSDEEAFQLIFERGLTTSENITLNAGRGVGMCIVKESIEGRGGMIYVASEPQQGTRFTITLPHLAVAESTSGLSKPDNTPLILIVDDSNSIRLVTSRMVETLNCRSVTAEDGAQALELLRSGSVKPDLILSDVEMPVMNGWQFLEELKSDASLGNIPVVMVTSLSDDASQQRAAELGADDYVVKPLELQGFERVLRTLGVAVTA